MDPHVFTIEDGRVAGRPGPDHTPWDLDALRRDGFGVIVSLECDRLDPEPIRTAGIEHRRICVEDFTAPTLEQLRTFNRLVDAKLAEGKRVLVHCYAGRGRTVAFLASRLIWKGAEVEEALETMARIARPALEGSQVAALHHFRRWVRTGSGPHP